MIRLKLNQELIGRILDIGGGGEGVIGRQYGYNVTAIDNRQEELDEAPNTFTKILMDAVNLSFEDESFDHVSFFYSLMYMDREIQHKAISEAARVLKKGGSLLIWDTVIQSAYPEPFLVELCIAMSEETIQTTYGVVKENAAQSENTFACMCEACGLTLYSRKTTGTSFSLVFTK